MRHLQAHGITNKRRAEDPDGGVGSVKHVQKVIQPESARHVVPALQPQCINARPPVPDVASGLEHPAPVLVIVEGINHEGVVTIELDIMRT